VYCEFVEFTLDSVEARVLGALIEKDLTTPEYYPLSLNALTNACNQKTNRDPVTNYDDDAVAEAIGRLRDKRLAAAVTGAGSRVEKYAHRMAEVFNFPARELAILCVLLLRGPQTPGELRERAGRIRPFDDLEAAEAAVNRLVEREPEPLVKRLPRAPGAKEIRYAHLFCGDVAAAEAAPAPAPPPDRVSRLEAEVAALRGELAELKSQFTEFRRQFES
jgi:uncharacterized protein YceH (UPF0502 family)